MRERATLSLKVYLCFAHALSVMSILLDILEVVALRCVTTQLAYGTRRYSCSTATAQQQQQHFTVKCFAQNVA